MSWYISLLRIFKTGARNLLRNAWLSSAATVVMVVTLTAILFSFVTQLVLSNTIHGLVNKIDVSIYLDDATTKTQIDLMKSQLQAVDNVKEVNFVSKADALARYRQQNATNPDLLQGVSDHNPLPASFEVKVRDQNNLAPITDFVNRADIKPLLLKSNPTTYEGARKQIIDRVIHTSNFIKTIGLVLSVLFVVIATLIIFNTIRIAIFTRREEIEIMQLVGATNWFIRGPFLVEAALYGIIAAVVATLLIYAMVAALTDRLSSYLDMTQVNMLFHHSPHLILLAELGIGVAIGVGSSLLAMSRYLKL